MIIYKNKKYLFVTRGIPGAGKSTFLKNTFKGKANIISPDELRIKLNGLIKTESGKLTIDQKNGAQIWKTVFESIKESILNNNITILDATSTCNKQLKKYYKLAEKNKVDFIIIDFSSVDIKEAIYRNSYRLPEYKRVSDEIIIKMYNRIKIPISEKLSPFVIDFKNLVLQFENE